MDKFNLDVFQYNYTLIAAIPQALRSKELYHQILEKYKYTFSYIPDAYKTKEMCKMFIRYISAKDIPLCLYDEELANLFVDRCPANISAVPIPFRSKELCKKAVMEDSKLLKYVPYTLQDKEICLDALEKDCNNFLSISPHLIDAEMCKYVLDVRPTVKMWNHIPSTLLTTEMCEKAVKRDYRLMKLIPSYLITRDLCLSALLYEPRVFKYIPDDFKDRTLCMTAIELDSKNFSYIPKSVCTKEFVLDAIEEEAEVYNHIRRKQYHIENVDFILEAIKRNYRVIKFVSCPTLEMCETAIAISPASLQLLSYKTKRVLLRLSTTDEEVKCCVCYEMCHTTTTCKHNLCRLCNYKLDGSTCPICRYHL